MGDQRRTVAERKADVLAALDRQADLWLASASRSGKPHLIAVSAWWDGSKFVVATTAVSQTARNLQNTPVARLAVGSPADVIVADVEVQETAQVGASTAVAQGFKKAVGWDPREVGPGWIFISLVPTRIQAYRGYDELEGRDVMRQSRWLD